MKHRNSSLYKFAQQLYRYWIAEYKVVVRNAEVLVFFFLLPLAYPLLYALIYNPEEVTDVPVAVVDNDGSQLSRQLVNHVDATAAVHVVGYCTDISMAREWMRQRKCYAILVIPDGLGKNVVSGLQGTVVCYTDMSLLLNYKTLLMALTDVTMAMGADVREQALPIGLSQSITDIVSNPIYTASVVLYNPTSGLASFLIPAVLILILQQSLILGIAVRGGGAQEQKRKAYAHHNIMAQLCGRTLCYMSLYIVNIVYLTLIVPRIFDYPHMGNPVEILLFTLPLILSSIFLSITLSQMVHEQEDAYLMFVFTSVLFLFLSGIAWPRYAMPPLWQWIASLLPSTWGIIGYVQMNTMAASLSQVSDAYGALWCLTILYFVLAYIAISLRTFK